MDNKDVVNEQIRELEPFDKLGIDSLPEQLIKKRDAEGYVFNILLVGETGIGKSALSSSLFNIPLRAPAEDHKSSTVQLQSKTYSLSEKSVNLKLTVIETRGYGDQINRIDNVTPITQYIESEFESYFKEELKMKRSLTPSKDSRIHACLYLLCPTGHNLKSLDVFCMKQLHDKVNLIPIVAKSDCLSVDELKQFKSAIRATIEREHIKIYRFPIDDEMVAESNSKSNDLVPFAMVASKEHVPVGGKLKRARSFPWGIMLVEDEKHSEYLALKRALIETNMDDLIRKTNDEFYEKYRETRLIQLCRSVCGEEPLTTLDLFEELRKKQLRIMQEKEESLKEIFAAKVRAKEDEIKTIEKAVTSKYNALFKKLQLQKDQLNDMEKNLDLEMFAFQRKRKSFTSMERMY